MKREVKIIILFLGIILTGFDDYWSLGIFLMILGYFLIFKEDTEDEW